MDLSQREFASDLGISLKALQSYEQGWRSVPAAIEKKILFYLAVLNRKAHPDIRDCWEIKKSSARDADRTAGPSAAPINSQGRALCGEGDSDR